MVRAYGNPPYTAALLHGGPGAQGSLACLAQELGKTHGVLEPIQSRSTVQGLLDELEEQLACYETKHLTLVGHSAGALLAILYAAQHQKQVHQLVLVGCPPLKDDYKDELLRLRCLRLSPDEQAELEAIVRQADPTPDTLERLEALTHKTDDFETDPTYDNPLAVFDAKQYQCIWPALANMRRGGVFLRALQQIDCRIVVLHGEHDPHPLRGVTHPLADAACDFVTCVLPMCGHSPYSEKHAKEPFVKMLEDLL